MSDLDFPRWTPEWLKKLVYEPNCTYGTHPELRRLAKWLAFYVPPAECPGLALYWLRFAADRCDRVPDDAELNRLLSWACDIVAQQGPGNSAKTGSGKPAIDTDYLLELILAGPRLDCKRCEDQL
jgi:hypothetical protein